MVTAPQHNSRSDNRYFKIIYTNVPDLSAGMFNYKKERGNTFFCKNNLKKKKNMYRIYT